MDARVGRPELRDAVAGCGQSQENVAQCDQLVSALSNPGGGSNVPKGCSPVTNAVMNKSEDNRNTPKSF